MPREVFVAEDAESFPRVTVEALGIDPGPVALMLLLFRVVADAVFSNVELALATAPRVMVVTHLECLCPNRSGDQ